MSIRRQYIAGYPINLVLEGLAGVASAATVEILHPETGSLGTAQAATLPTATTTLTADAEPRQPNLTVASGTGFSRGEQVVLTSTTGEAAIDELNGVGTSALLLKRGVPFALPTGSTVQATRLTYNAGAALARTRGYRAVWVITLSDGSQDVRFQVFDVIRQPFAVDVSQKYLEGLWPGIKLPGDWRDTLLVTATENLIDWLNSRELEPDLVKDPRPFTAPAAYWICYRLAVTGGQAYRPADVDRFDTDLHRSLSRLERAKYWYDCDDDDTREATDLGVETGNSVGGLFF